MTAGTGDVGVGAHPPPAVEEEEGEEGAGGDHNDDDDGQGPHVYGDHVTAGDFVWDFDVFHISIEYNTDWIEYWSEIYIFSY